MRRHGQTDQRAIAAAILNCVIIGPRAVEDWAPISAYVAPDSLGREVLVIEGDNQSNEIRVVEDAAGHVQIAMKCATREHSLAVLAVLLTVLTCLPSVNAKKPDKPGGGGGDAAYTIIPFMPAGSESISSDVTDLNEQGQAVGILQYANGDREAFHLDIASGEYRTLAGGVWATGVNKWNEVVGSDDVSGLFWSSPTASPIALSPLSGDLTSWAEGINDDGIVIGASESVDEDGNFVAVPVGSAIEAPDGAGRNGSSGEV